MRCVSGKILRHVKAGEVLIVARRGLSVAQLTPYAGDRRATKPARQESIFGTSDLTTTAIDSETVLNDLRGKR